MQPMNDLIDQPETTRTMNENTNETNDTDEPTESKEQEKNPFTSGAICLADLANAPLPKVDFVVERLAICARSRVTLFVGRAANGKSLTASYLAACVALNLPVFGKYEVRPGQVLHIDYEMGSLQTQLKYRQIVAGLGVDLDVAPGIWFRSFPGMRLDEPGARDHLARAVEDKQLVIIDPLCRATSASDNDPRIADVLAMCGELSNQLGVTFIFLHHLGKRLDVNGYGRGSSAIQDAAGCVLRVSSPERGRFLIEQVKAVPQPVAPLAFRIEEVGGLAPETRCARGLRLVEYDADSAPVITTTNKLDVRQEIIRHLEEHPDGMGSRSLRQATGGNTSRFVQSLRVLVAQGIVVARPDPNDLRKTTYVLVRNTPAFEPKAGQLIPFPGHHDQSDEGDDV